MKRLCLPAFLLLVGCASQKPPPTEEPPPPVEQPKTVAQPPPQQQQPPPQQPPPEPVKDQRAEALALVGTIEAELAQHAKTSGADAIQHAEAIHRATEQLQGPLSGNPPSAGPYAEVKKHADKLLEASRKKEKKDMAHHRHELEEAVKALRASM